MLKGQSKELRNKWKMLWHNTNINTIRPANILQNWYINHSSDKSYNIQSLK